MFMSGRSKKTSLFFKYLASYMAILFIPLVFTSVFVFGYFDNILKNNITDGNLTMLTQVKNVVDGQVWEFNKISNQIFNNSKLRPYALNQNTSAKIEAIQELRNYMIGNDFIYNLVLYIKNTDLLFSANSTYDTYNFINFVFKYKNWNYNEFFSDINNLTKPSFRYSENVFLSGSNSSARFITYMMPGSQSTVIFLLDENKLKNLISAKSSSNFENTIILDDNFNSIISNSGGPYTHSREMLNLVKRIDDKGTGNIKIDKSNYCYSIAKSSVTGWVYITLIPESEALKSVFEVRLKMLCGWLLIFLTGCCMIFCLMYYNYYPIKNLKKLAEERWGQKINGHNEIEVVRSVINQMANNGIEMKKNLNDSRMAVKDSLLLELLRGQFGSAEEFNSSGRGIGLSIRDSRYIVCIFYSHKFKDIKREQRLEIEQRLEDGLPDGIDGLGRDGVDERTIILILSVSEYAQNFIRAVLQNLKNEISSLYNINTTVGAGNCCESTEQIGKSYLEASIAIDYKFILGEDKIIFFNEILICNSNNIVYPEKELKDIQLYIKQGNISCIEESLSAILKSIKDNEMPIAIARCVCFDIINSVLKTVNEIGIFSIVTKKEYFKMETLNNFNTIEELTGIIKRICTDLCNDIRNSKESRNFDLKDKLIKYVEENCNSSSFCVKAMADAFGLSQSYLSRFFKDQTGQSISDYQLLLRMEKAKQYLRTTDEPIKNIVDMIGYCNEASFVRLFKKAEGITPGEYRKMCRGDRYIDTKGYCEMAEIKSGGTGPT